MTLSLTWFVNRFGQGSILSYGALQTEENTISQDDLELDAVVAIQGGDRACPHSVVAHLIAISHRLR